MRSRGLQSGDDAAGRSAWARRVVLGGIGTAGATVALAAFAASAFANAANPTGAHGAPLVDLPNNGGVLVQLSGSWSWGELGSGIKTSPQNNCDGRYGVGWSVDWWGINNSTAPTAGKGPTTASMVSIANKATPPTNVGQQNASVGGTWQIKPTGQIFHTTTQYNGFEANLCPKTASNPTGNPDITLDKNGAPSGSWSASAVYPNRAAIPDLVCVNFYDPHGSLGAWSTSSKDLTASADDDNSIKTNDFNPAQPQYCFSPTPDKVSINVVKDNNAGGGAFADSNTAGSLDEDVTFRVGIANKGTVPVTVSSVTDAIQNGSNIGSVLCTKTQGGNDSILGTVIPVDGSTTCFFTVPKYLTTYLPNGQTAATDDVVVNVTSTAGNTQDDDTSVVNKPAGFGQLDVVKFGPSTGVASHTGDYRVKLSNVGTATVRKSITFYDKLPVGEKFSKVVGGPSAPFTDANMTCTADAVTATGQLVTCTYNHDLDPGDSANVWIEVTYNAGTEGKTLTDCVGLDPTKAVPGVARADQCVDTKILEPHLQILKTGQDTGVPGGSGRYTITVTNNGAGPATTVSFVDQLPPGETFESADGDFKCSQDLNDATKINCAIKTALLPLGSGDSVSVNVLVTYGLTTREGDQLKDCAILPSLDQSCKITIIHTPDLTIKKTGPATGVAGSQGKYTIVVKNTGQADAKNVSFQDVLPAGETFSSASTGVFTCTKTGNPQVINCTLDAGTLAVGASASVDVTVTYDLGTDGRTLTDCAVLAPDNQSCVPTKIPSKPSISVVKTNDANGDGIFHDSEQAANPGDAVTFKVVITNTSGDPIALDSISDAYAAVTNAAKCPQLITTVLQPGDSVTCVFTVDNYAPAAGDSLTDTVTVGGHQVPGGTPVTGTDTSTVTTKNPKTPGPDLAIVKQADQDKVKAGDTLTYTLSVSNVGDGPTTGTVAVFDTVPSGLDLVSVGGTNWDCSNSGANITCVWDGGVVNPGDVLPDITVVTTVNSTASVVVVNTGVVNTPGDTNPFNNRSTVKTPVTQVLGEKVTKPKTPTTVLPFTGDRTGQLLPVGTLAILVGLLLMVAGRRRRRTA